MKRRPVIGIIAKHYEDPNGLWSDEYAHSNLIKLLREKGVIPIIIPLDPDSYQEDIEYDKEGISDNDHIYMNTILDKIDGLILQGGLKSSELEIRFAYHCILRRIPLLGICAGFNNIARALDLPLVDLEEEELKYHNIEELGYRHEIQFTKDSILQKIFSCSVMKVNSIHKIGMRLEDVYNSDIIDILATANDGTVEAFGVKRRSNVIAVKWHPELMMGNRYSHLLFRYFIDMAYQII